MATASHLFPPPFEFLRTLPMSWAAGKAQPPAPGLCSFILTPALFQGPGVVMPESETTKPQARRAGGAAAPRALRAIPTKPLGVASVPDQETQDTGSRTVTGLERRRESARQEFNDSRGPVSTPPPAALASPKAPLSRPSVSFPLLCSLISNSFNAAACGILDPAAPSSHLGWGRGLGTPRAGTACRGLGGGER